MRSIGKRLRTLSGRAEGEDIKVSRDLQRNFQKPEMEVERRTAVYVAQYLKAKSAEWVNVRIASLVVRSCVSP
jgi:hypothetical protein